MDYRISTIASGEAGTDQTISAMAELVERSLHEPSTRNLALSIVRPLGLDSRRPLALARALFRWVKTNVKYVYDPLDVETIQHPLVTVRLGAGDCDDFAILLVALARSVGIPARFRVVGPSPDSFEHVYAEFLVNGRWLAADPVVSTQLGRSLGFYSSTKSYAFGGLQMNGIDPAYYPDVAESVAYDAARQELSRQWQNKTINRGLIAAAMAQAVAPTSVISDPAFQAGAVRAMRDFLSAVTVDQYVPSAGLAGLGVGGLIGGIWGAIKGAWEGVKNIVTGGGDTTTVVQEAPSPWSGFLSGPVPWVVGAALVIMALRSGK
jgi:hypothetical protein